MKKITLLIIVIAIGGVALYFFQPKKSEKIHYHAGFQVYKDDKLVDFSDLRFMHIKPCKDNEGEEMNDPKEDQIDKAHLHDGVGDIVHVHGGGGKWKDLFINLKYSIATDIKAYSNGQEVSNILEKSIEPYESVVFFIGKTSDIEQKLKTRVTKQHIKDVEGSGESC